MYTIKQLKKMSTERLHKVFQSVMGYMLFNPYEERELMIALIPCIEDANVIQTPEVLAVIEVDWNEETQSIGMRVYHPIITKIFAAINEDWLPKRTETKGRKSRFTYREIWDMLYCDLSGARLTDIAQYYETSCAVVLQILEGRAYNWASGIPQNGNE